MNELEYRYLCEHVTRYGIEDFSLKLLIEFIKAKNKYG